MTNEIPLTETKQGGCNCGCSHDEPQIPELVAHDLPREIRHGAILGAIGSLEPGASLILVAPHDPLPLLAQATERFGDQIRYDYVDRAPDAVRVKFTRAQL